MVDTVLGRVPLRWVGAGLESARAQTRRSPRSPRASHQRLEHETEHQPHHLPSSALPARRLSSSRADWERVIAWVLFYEVPWSVLTQSLTWWRPPPPRACSDPSRKAWAAGATWSVDLLCPSRVRASAIFGSQVRPEVAVGRWWCRLMTRDRTGGSAGWLSAFLPRGQQVPRMVRRKNRPRHYLCRARLAVSGADRLSSWSLAHADELMCDGARLGALASVRVTLNRTPGEERPSG